MAEKDPQVVDKKEVAENNPEAGGDSGSFSFWKRYQPVFIVTALVVAECIAAFFFVPSGNPVFAEGDLTPEQLLVLQQAGLVQTEAPPEKEPQVEVDMGEYTITHSSQSEGATTYVEFHLFGVIDNTTNEEFTALVGENENRIRDLIRSIVRESPISELADPGLGLIKNRILEKVNRLLGKQILKAVVFGNYTFVER